LFLIKGWRVSSVDLKGLSFHGGGYVRMWGWVDMDWVAVGEVNRTGGGGGGGVPVQHRPLTPGAGARRAEAALLPPLQIYVHGSGGVSMEWATLGRYSVLICGVY
jgi:hypothetical protein